MVVTFVIEEGERYRFGAINLVIGSTDINQVINSTDIDRESLNADLKTIQGETYNAQKIEATIYALRDRAAELGFPSVELACPH